MENATFIADARFCANNQVSRQQAGGREVGAELELLGQRLKVKVGQHVIRQAHVSLQLMRTAQDMYK